MKNEEIIQMLVQKGLITGAALSTAGKLNPAQADKFIDYVFDQTMLKGFARMVKFSPESMEIDKIGVADRVAWPKSMAKAPQVRRGVTHSKITLTPVEVIVPFEIGDIYKEINIEGADVEDHIVKMMATQFANNMEQLYIRGDTNGEAVLEGDIVEGGSTTGVIADPFLALFNGWSRLLDSGNVYDAGGSNISDSIYSRMLNTLPEKYKRHLDKMAFLSPTNLEQLYRERTGTRATAAGDQARVSRQSMTPFGVDLLPVPLMQFNPTVVEHITLGNNGVAIPLRYGPILSASEYVNLQTLDLTPTLPYTEGAGNDYVMDYTNGTIAADAGGALANTAVKVTYQANPQTWLTLAQNLIIGVGRDVRIERDRDIFAGTDQFVMTAKIAVEIEEVEATVKAINVGTTI